MYDLKNATIAKIKLCKTKNRSMEVKHQTDFFP